LTWFLDVEQRFFVEKFLSFEMMAFSTENGEILRLENGDAKNLPSWSGLGSSK
jgi:hypothetical protein